MCTFVIQINALPLLRILPNFRRLLKWDTITRILYEFQYFVPISYVGNLRFADAFAELDLPAVSDVINTSASRIDGDSTAIAYHFQTAFVFLNFDLAVVADHFNRGRIFFKFNGLIVSDDLFRFIYRRYTFDRHYHFLLA
ncbi:hypothetical protein QE152_g26144 [Popillia japonica]|uniref:Uncharacterized protein n=1 Tax=Popillia japonica TaxID=7064 RepID=A0AAW1JZ47_POPJA